MMKKKITVKPAEIVNGNGVVKCVGLKLNRAGSALVAETRGLPVLPPEGKADEKPWSGSCPVPVAVSAGTVQAVLPAVTLKGEYGSGTSTLTLEDNETITGDYLATLEVLHSRANAIAAFSQPVIATVTVMGHNGKTLYRGMPTLLCPNVEGGINCLQHTRTVEYANGNYKKVASATLIASCFRVGLRWDDLSEDEIAAISYISISVTPQLQVCDFKGQCPTRIGHYLSTAATLDVGMPGVALGASPERAFQGILVTALMHLNDIAMPMATVPVEDAENSYFATSGMSAYDERQMLLNRTTASNTGLNLIPGTYTSGASAVNGTIKLLGNLVFSPNGIFSPAEMADKIVDDAWTGSIRVKYSDGRQDLVALYSSTKQRPQHLGPLISIPDAAAISLTVTINHNVWEIPLTPTPDAMHAYAFNLDGFAPVGLGIPETVVSGTAAVDATLLVATDLNGSALTFTRLPKEVVAITPARNATGGLQFGQVCFYVFSVGGIFVARLNSAQNRLALSQIDSRPVLSAPLVTETGHGTVAVAANNLVCVNGNRVETIETDVDYRALAWSDQTGELWLQSITGMAIRRGIKGSQRSPGFPITKFTRSGSSVVYLSDGQWYQPDTQLLSNNTVEVQWGARICDIESRLRGIVWKLTSQRFKGVLEIYGANEADPALPRLLLQRLNINGPLNHRVVSNLIAPFFPVIEVRIVGIAAGNTVFNGCTLLF